MKQRIRLLLSLIKYRIGLIGKKVVLLDTPEHDNLGDQAIAVAEEQFLRENNLPFRELTASQIDGKEKWYARFTPAKKVVLIQGGGFLGSLWPNEEYRVRRILNAFFRHKVIIFPQTVFFDHKNKFFEESRKVYNGHPNLTVFVREARSFGILHDYFPNVQYELVPDMVLYIKTKAEITERRGFLMCMRNDEEKVLSSAVSDEILRALRMYGDEEIRYTDTLCGYAVNKSTRLQEIQKKLCEFSQAKLVVTDRLHGMILAAITGTPCIAFQNVNGKVGGVYHWLKNLNYVYSVNTINEFREALSKLDLNRVYSYSNKPYVEEFEKIRKIICPK